ncbi:alcohol dehydrogenase catalytic domain-containing protein [Jatrophihabitans sp. DSM 44399]|uniref:Alcohol dehydrogenase catalytic domain-containing protein n=1 Tax=Jatrophihabitans lederbergiae TaxID=3075547 RepID=A0ABU2JEJ3_9ACTN|nr:zinc-binding dehydrogenase [Jatrophihabitans sp. DSM 44399]MDT0262879.1 alcohol dehydrogenase catalytic domain-containing protein [Jatrophihabitans sp. DSM 44399]
MSATCVCGSDLWDYRGINPVTQPTPMGHEYVGAGGAQAQYLRVPLADGTLVATPEVPGDDLMPSLLAASDVLGTGWFGAVAADVQPGNTVAVVGDGAVGLLGVLAAKQLGAERIIAFSRHEARQNLAREFGATDIVTERGAQDRSRRQRTGRRRGQDQGPHQRARRTQRHRGRRYAGVDDAGHPLHPPRRPRRLRRRLPRRHPAR